MRDFLDELRARLAALRADGLERRLSLPGGVDFASNDYLGLSRHPRLREALLGMLRSGPIGAPASRLLRGNTAEHERLEGRLARLKGAEASLFFPSGYQANVGLLTAILRRDDFVLSDEQNHASIIDGLRLCGCRTTSYPHADAGALEKALAARPPGGRAFVVTESLFSMDGDIPPLDRYADIADSGGASLIVDDAHATGLYGDARGSGLVERFGLESSVLATVSTCGKALGLAGAFVAGPSVLVEYLVNKCRPLIFSTAPPPLLLAGIEAALDLLEVEPWRRARALELADRLRRALVAARIDCLRSEGPIVPVILGRNDLALRVAEGVRGRGFDVRAIRPPAVRPRTARLRISVHADHSEEQIDGLAGAVIEELEAARRGAAPAPASAPGEPGEPGETP